MGREGRTTRIDLFVVPGCGGSAEARRVVAAFARDHAVEVHEWDLAADPGPARGRGIFITPSLLVDGRHVVVGVPSRQELLRHLAPAPVPLGPGAGS